MASLLSSIPLLVVLLAAGAAPMQETPPGAPAAPHSGQVMTVDPETCRGCHEDVLAGTFDATHHASLPNACGSCHTGDLAAHAEQADPELVTTPSELSPRQRNELCLGCHEKGHQAEWMGSMHERRGLDCTSCHSVHHFESLDAQLKEARATETCAGCHPAVRAQTMRQSHHPVREGKMDCGSCHNPHGARPKMILANSTNELCYQCHAEKRGPFLWEHAPVRENCTLCHAAHGSNHDNLLVAKQPFLCQRCHLNTRHPGTLYDGRNFIGGPSPSNRAVGNSCSNCHSMVHGSNHPSGPYLGR